jgi:hypothetical protein
MLLTYEAAKMENFGVEFLMDVTMADMHVIITKTTDDGWLLYSEYTFPEYHKKKQIKITEKEASAIAALLVGEGIFDEDSTLMLYEIAEPVMYRLGDNYLRCIP